jgi:hypothetical protein
MAETMDVAFIARADEGQSLPLSTPKVHPQGRDTVSQNGRPSSLEL